MCHGIVVRRRACWVSMLCGVALNVGNAIAVAQVVNYDDDPDLALAMQCDPEMNHVDLDAANREVAEEKYLEYLKRSDLPGWQRARVYTQLGTLFSTNLNPRRNEKPDRGKAQQYFAAAVAAAPDLSGVPMLRAHSGLGASGSRQVRMQACLEALRWGMSIARRGVRETWLPRFPGDVPSEPDVAQVRKVLDEWMWVESKNLVSGARRDPETLQRIVRKLPGSLAATEALELLMTLGQSVGPCLAGDMPAVDADSALVDAMLESPAPSSGASVVSDAGMDAHLKMLRVLLGPDDAESVCADDVQRLVVALEMSRFLIVPGKQPSRTAEHLVEAARKGAETKDDGLLVRGHVEELRKLLADALRTRARQLLGDNSAAAKSAMDAVAQRLGELARSPLYGPLRVSQSFLENGSRQAAEIANELLPDKGSLAGPAAAAHLDEVAVGIVLRALADEGLGKAVYSELLAARRADAGSEQK